MTTSKYLDQFNPAKPTFNSFFRSTLPKPRLSQTILQPAPRRYNHFIAVSMASDMGNTDDVLVQYVVMRRDLIDSWPMGSVITQGCHASVAAVWMNREDHYTTKYCGDDNLDKMHK
ncbi:uncharacterized protein LOC131040962 isoform X2 [Cryptomeria japonica]|nr:uncharacterized protein LOC131040962 isoform X2 [Cryptomeria japonica]